MFCTCKIRNLLSSSAPQDGQTALYIASWKGNEMIVDLLIGARCNIDAQTKVRACLLYIMIVSYVCLCR